MTRLAAVLVGGPPATGKSTLASALAPRLGAAVLDLDVATGPLVRVISGLIGVTDLDDPALAGLTRDARYETLLALANANLRAGRPVILVAPFSAERARPAAWAATAQRLTADPVMVWLHLPPDELVRRLTQRALGRDENKIRDPASFLAGLDLAAPAIPHLALDATQPTATLVQSILDHLSQLDVPGPRSLQLPDSNLSWASVPPIGGMAVHDNELHRFNSHVIEEQRPDRSRFPAVHRPPRPSGSHPELPPGPPSSTTCHRWHNDAQSRYAIDGTIGKAETATPRQQRRQLQKRRQR